MPENASETASVGSQEIWRCHLTQEEIRDKARSIHNWLQDAVGDAAFSTYEEDVDAYYGRAVAKQFKQISRRSDIYTARDWLADEIYNMEDVMSALAGDRLHDSAKDDETRVLVAKELASIAHPALKAACEEFIERR